LPCSMIAIEDVVHTLIDKPIIIKFLKNDQVCGVEWDDKRTSIEIDPKHGQVILMGDSIQYFPSIGYSGNDVVVYKVFREGDTEPTSGQYYSYGIITISVLKHELEEDQDDPGNDSEMPPTGWTVLQNLWYPSKIYFISENVGFAAGEYNQLLKTVDGGVSWENVAVKTDDGINWWYRNVYFVNSFTGYVTAAKHGEGFAQLDDFAIFKTNDGGNVWQRIPFMDGKTPVNSIYFVSSTTGFVTSGSQIFKTSDGGNSWRLVNGVTGWIGDFTFFSPTNGFILNNGALLKTDDGGDNWVEVNEITSVKSLAVSGNRAFALTGEDHYPSNPDFSNFQVWSTLDGSDWEPVFSQDKMPPGVIAFSPSGNFGMVASYYSRDDNRRTLSVWITKDGGSTWVNQKLNSSGYPYWSASPIGISIASEKSALMLVNDDIGWQALLKYSVD
jgi:photosystem II stability/assembly factor-like uncharacterized protein